MIVSGWSIDRGRSYELDKVGPGSATITLIDTTGELDPTATAYPFDPGTPAAIALHNPVLDTDHTVFRGHIARFDYDMYQNQRYAIGTLELVDGMALMAATEMVPGFLFGPGPGFGDIGPSTSVGEIYYSPQPTTNGVAIRINQVLDELGWANGDREIFSGNVKLKETIYAIRTSALNVIQDAADSEFPGVANFYIQKDGRATFHGRLARFIPADAQYHISTWRCGDMAAVAADSTRALIFELAYDVDSEKVINSATSTPQGIADADIQDQWVADETSMATYGTRSISFENLLTDGGPGGTTALVETKKFATYYVDNMASHSTRVNKITFKSVVGDVSSYSDRLWRVLCNVDISDIIRLKTTHQLGGFDDVDFFVEGLHYEARPLTADYDDVTLTLDVSPRALYNTNPF